MDINSLDVSKLELNDGDILVIRLPRDTSRDVINHTHKMMMGVLERAEIQGVQVIMDPLGAEFEIIRGAA